MLFVVGDRGRGLRTEFFPPSSLCLCLSLSVCVCFGMFVGVPGESSCPSTNGKKREIAKAFILACVVSFFLSFSDVNMFIPIFVLSGCSFGLAVRGRERSLRLLFGCHVFDAGKSNLMDAISFVMGLRAGSLRGNSLRDLIYSGDRSHKVSTERE